ncbi:hypothetical protein OKW51_003129 [Pseudomonas hunanensis]|nr:hypothetical protein [Pseudomonas hunanensis]
MTRFLFLYRVNGLYRMFPSYSRNHGPPRARERRA